MKALFIAAAVALLPATAMAKGATYTYQDRTECSAYYTTLGTIGDFKDLSEIEASSWAGRMNYEDEQAHPEDDILHSGKIFHDVSSRYRAMQSELPRNPSAQDIAAFRAKYDKKCRAIAKQQCALAEAGGNACDVFTPAERENIYSSSDNRH